MKRLKLKIIQRQAYKVTTQRKHIHPVADNLINQDFILNTSIRCGRVM